MSLTSEEGSKLKVQMCMDTTCGQRASNSPREGVRTEKGRAAASA